MPIALQRADLEHLAPPTWPRSVEPTSEARLPRDCETEAVAGDMLAA